MRADLHRADAGGRGESALPAQDLPEWVLNLARIKRQARANFEHLPDYACHETIERYHREPRSESISSVDTLHLEVAVIGRKEMFAKAGAGQFDVTDLSPISRPSGATGTGSFSGLVYNLFVNDNGLTTGWADDAVGDRRALRYDFSMSEMMSGNIVSNGTVQVTTAVHGSYWADASSFDLLRVEEHAVDIPPALDMSDVTTIIDYQKTKVGNFRRAAAEPGGNEPSRSVGAAVVRNVTEFSGCRQYGSDSVIHFDGPETGSRLHRRRRRSKINRLPKESVRIPTCRESRRA